MLVVTLSIPTLPPTSSKSLRRHSVQRNHQSDSDSASVAVTTPSTPDGINTPSVKFVPPPFLFPTTSQSVSEASPLISSRSTQQVCFDTPDWGNIIGHGCDWYEENDDPGYPRWGHEFGARRVQRTAVIVVEVPEL